MYVLISLCAIPVVTELMSYHAEVVFVLSDKS